MVSSQRDEMTIYDAIVQTMISGNMLEDFIVNDEEIINNLSENNRE